MRRRSTHAKYEGIWGDGSHVLNEDLRKIGIGRELHVKSTMRLYVLEWNAVPTREFPQCTDLVDQIVHDLLARAVDFPPAEALQIVVAGMSPNADAVLGGHTHCLIHQVGISGMKAGGDIGRAYKRDNMVVARIANAPASEGFPHVAIDIDNLLQAKFLMLFQGRISCRMNAMTKLTRRQIQLLMTHYLIN
jgi:hypothetical protein